MKTLYPLAFLFLFIVDAPAPAQDALQVLTPYLDDDSILVGQIDVGNIDVDATFARLRPLAFDAERQAEMAAAQKSGQQVKDRLLAAGVKRAYFTIVGNPLQFEVLFVAPAMDTQAAAAALASLGFKTRIAESSVLFGSASAVKQSARQKGKTKADWPNALAKAANAPCFAVLLPPRALVRALGEVQPVLPAELGGGPTTPLLDAFQWASLNVDLSAKLKIDLHMQMKDETSAKRLDRIVDGAIAMQKKMPQVREMPSYAKLLTDLRPKQAGAQLALSLDAAAFDATIVPLASKVHHAASATQARNNLKQFGIAMHNFHDINKTLPPQASAGKDGKPLLSWRVQILPYIDENALYKEFHLDEPWDSEHNKKLIPRMPAIYVSPHSALKRTDGKTTIVVPAGPKLVFNGTQKMTLRDITDGTTNTILIMDVDDSKAVLWTKPDDYPVEQNKPNVGHFRPSVGQIVVALCDASVAGLSTQLSDDVLWRLFCPTDGQPVGFPFVED